MRIYSILSLAVLATTPYYARPAASVDESGPGWGKERDGIRARLILEGGRGLPEREAAPMRFVIGDTLTVRLALKNVSPIRKAYKLKGLRDWSVGLSHELITLDPGQGEPALVDLGPGEERIFDGIKLNLKPLTALAGPPDVPILP